MTGKVIDFNNDTSSISPNNNGTTIIIEKEKVEPAPISDKVQHKKET